ncbi:hypothetical protein Dda_4613 [Drechslerella dactyloides]|uniref:Ubiquitin carboxyl-terminal hydrolase n=1 Tax=Drechslerella dactyloides TaxID=74499 RepID=A0AAD6IY08_DREDA|nr:hypothetical protein Dda_4613 [Drechslerella dactyloides]
MPTCDAARSWAVVDPFYPPRTTPSNIHCGHRNPYKEGSPNPLGFCNLIMNNHQHPQAPLHGTYLPLQMMGPPQQAPQRPQPLSHHQSQLPPPPQRPQQPHQPHPPQHPYQHHHIPYQHPHQHDPQYSQHPHLPPSQGHDFRPQHFHQHNRPVIVSTPYMPHYMNLPMLPHSAPGQFYQPPQPHHMHQMHPEVPPFYPTHRIPLQPPTDIPSPTSLPPDPVSDPTSSPSRSPEAVEEPNEARYETPITSSSSVPTSPMVPHVLPHSDGVSFKPPRLPWFSAPGQSFPARKARIPKGARSKILDQSPAKDSVSATTSTVTVLTPISNNQSSRTSEEKTPNGCSVAHSETNGTSQTATELPEDSAAPPATQKTEKSAPRPAVPVPVVPFIPAIHKPRKSTENATGPPPVELDKTPETQEEPAEVPAPVAEEIQPTTPEVPTPPPAPKSWAELVKRNTSTTATTGPSQYPPSVPNGNTATSGASAESQGRTLADVLQTFTTRQSASSRTDSTAPLVEPRGLINTGNMCFMNSILQALLFCGPFYMFLDAISRSVSFNFKGETPLIDSMIIFIREFRRVQAGANNAPSQNGAGTVALAGNPFVPEYVYEAVRGLKRFSSMRRGHQQDAEEFLNFFLDVLHEECVTAMKANPKTKQGPNSAPHSEAATSEDDEGWLEVGHKRKAAITREVGHVGGTSPVTKIFGGQMRNELRVSGQRSSVNREPYQSLQLDIQSGNISNIMDAIRQISIPEQLQGGDFKSARGASTSATKQTLLESVPPVLILHLKRFRYNDTGGTQKIWKGIGYPLELEIPSEVLSPARRSASNPKYKLISVVYHHGKSATNGHYTVDVRRQDGWLRIDDTVVRRISETDVATDGSMQDRESQRNGGGDENGWREVSFATKVSGKGPSAGSAPPREDKVAYLLFYELQ